MIESGSKKLFGFSIFCLFFFTVRYIHYSSYILGNAGVTSLNHSLSSNEPESISISKTITVLKQAVDYSWAGAWRGLGLALDRQGKYDEADISWQKSGEKGLDFIARGQRAQALGQLEEAIRWYERARKLENGMGDTWYYLARVYEKLGDNQKAIDSYEQGLQLAQFYTIGKSDLYLAQGLVYARQGDKDSWSLALELYTKAIQANDLQQNQARIRVLYARAEALRHLEQYEQAREGYMAVLALQPKHYWANVYLAETIWRFDGDPLGAKTFLLRAIDSNSQYKFAYKLLGEIFVELGEWQEAFDVYDRLLEIDPEDSKALEMKNLLLQEIQGALPGQ